MTRVLVAGGRGFMGRRVVRLLRQTLPTVEVLTAGRSAANNRSLDVCAPAIESLSGVNVLINTVGPFNYDPAPLVRACIDNGLHYLDLAEADAFISKVSAFSGRTAVVSGCSSVPGLIQVLASRWERRSDVAGVRAQLSIGTNNPGSSTLLYSMLEPIGRRCQDGRWFNSSWLRDHPQLGKRRYGNYPSGVRTVPLGNREVPLQFGFGLDRRSYTRILGLAAPLIGRLPRRVLRLEACLMSVFMPFVRPFGSKIGVLAVDALSEAGEVLDSVELRAKANGLDVPAWPSVWATQALLATPQSAGRLSDILTLQSLEPKLRAVGYELYLAH